MTAKPFTGVKILDFTRVLAGPYGSYQLALLGRRRHQGRKPRRRRHALRLPRHRLGEARARRPLGRGQLQQALDHARPQEAQGDRGGEEARRQGRRGDGEFPAGRDGQARHRLRGAEGGQPQADLLRRLGLRPGRPGPRDRGVRRHDPGDVRPDVDHRLPDQRPDARRLRRRRRHVGRDGGTGRRLGALPAHRIPARASWSTSP